MVRYHPWVYHEWGACVVTAMKLVLVPLTLGEANELVLRWHRHHEPVQGHRFSIGRFLNGYHPVGAAIIGNSYIPALPLDLVVRMDAGGGEDSGDFGSGSLE